MANILFFRFLVSAQDPISVLDTMADVFGGELEYILYIRDIGVYMNSLLAEHVHATPESRPVSDLVRKRRN